MQLPRFYPILDSALLQSRGLSLVAAARAILEGGARILQFRHKGPFTGDIFDQAEAISKLCIDAGAAYILNDRADIALMLNAGLHVGQEDLSPIDARKIIGPTRMLGFSTHNASQFEQELGEPVDYLAFGPVFSTSSKLNPDPVAGLQAIEAAAKARGGRPIPLVAIGGITRARAASVLACGADSIAVIADLYPDPLTPESLKTRVQEWLEITV